MLTIKQNAITKGLLQSKFYFALALRNANSALLELGCQNLALTGGDLFYYLY
jgi:hypothetical protein